MSRRSLSVARVAAAAAALLALAGTAGGAPGGAASVSSPAAPAPSAAASASAGASASAVSGGLLPRSARARQIAGAIAELDVERARKLVESASGEDDIAVEKARLAVYLGDCDTAGAIAASLPRERIAEVAEIAELARGCSRATASALVVHDRAKGVWLRLQDDEDQALVPFILDVVEKARAAIERDIGTRLPRPLRIDLVRDLFSLAAVSGLPLDAAETTGTVAVARWGRVTMVSPRAMSLGFPWEDTLAHEITHLALSRATRERAPLWLQEGLAKREETRWRDAHPFDGKPDPDEVALDALIAGKSVGVQSIGPSIALLPSPESASIAFAEVSSFVAWWMHENGDAALHLLLADLAGTGSEDLAMRSVTGWPLGAWIERWKAGLLQRVATGAARGKKPATRARVDTGNLLRRVRLSDLLWARGHAGAAAGELGPLLEAHTDSAPLRFRLGRALRAAGELEKGGAVVQSFDQVGGIHGGWCALHAWFLARAGDGAGADQAFRLARGLDPLSEVVACRGEHQGPDDRDAGPGPLPTAAAERALCESARRIPRD